MTLLKEKSDEQKDAEAVVDDFRQDRGPFVVAAETTRMPMVFTDAKAPGNPIIFANDAFLALTGYRRDEVLAQSFNALMERGHPESVEAIKAAFEGVSASDPVIHYCRKDASTFWVSVFINHVRSQSGEVVQHFISFIDLTQHREEQAHALMLIEELNHRVKNTLQAALSIVAEAFRHGSDPAAIRASIESRVYALARSHDLLMSDNWEGAGLHDLVETALEPFTDADGRAGRIEITGANTPLTPRATLALGVAFHELAMNAVKFGALSTALGSVQIAWASKATPEGERLLIDWREKDGPAVMPRTRKGFGSRAIEQGLAYEMGGKVHLEFPSTGVACTIDIPMPRRAGHE